MARPDVLRRENSKDGARAVLCRLCHWIAPYSAGGDTWRQQINPPASDQLGVGWHLHPVMRTSILARIWWLLHEWQRAPSVPIRGLKASAGDIARMGGKDWIAKATASSKSSILCPSCLGLNPIARQSHAKLART